MRYAMEEWRSVAGYEGYYEVSSLGRVRSLPREKGFRKDVVVLKPVKVSNGYLKVTLSKGVSYKKLVSVHTLVAQAFLGGDPEGSLQVNHINTDKEDNRSDNLEWVTQSQNMSHPPSKTARALSLSKKVKQIDLLTLEVVKEWPSVLSAAASLGLCNSSICKAVKTGKPHKGFLWRYPENLSGDKGARPVIQEPEGILWETQAKLRKAGYDLYLVRECCKGLREKYKGSTWRWAQKNELKKENL